MDIYPLFFLIVFFVGSLASLAKDPLWGLLTYVFVYFNIPGHQWWGNQLPGWRWSLISAAVLLVSCFIHQEKLSRLKWTENRPGKYLLGLLGLMLVMGPFTPFPEQAWEKSYDFFRYVLIFFMVGKVLSDFRRYKAFLGILLFCTFYLTVLAHHHFDGARLDGVGLPDASDANMLAALMILFLPLFLVIGITERGWIRWAALGALPLVLNTFVMCGSRGAFVGIIAQGALALWLLRKHIGLKKAVACCAVVAVGLTFLMSDQYRERLFGMKQGLQEETLVETSAGRWETWEYGLDMAKDYPLGAGGGAFMTMSPGYLPEYLLEKSVGVRASHNTYLLILVEQGFFGLLVFIGFLWLQFSVLTKARRPIVAKGVESLSEEQRAIVLHTYSLQIALAGFWTAAFFIDRVYFEAIYLLVATTPALYHFAQESTASLKCVAPLTLKRSMS